MSRLRSLAVNLAVAVLSASLFLGGVEVVCRAIEPARPASPVPTAAYITQWMEGGDAFFTVKSTAVGWPPWEDYNHEGVRDREHALAKAPGTRRVVCLGDSVTLGYGIAPREAYPQVLQDLLAAQGLPVEVFNLSLGGWTTRQELIAYRRLARKYAPDQVLLGVCLNDIPEMENNLARPPQWLMAAHTRSALVRRLVGAHDREIHSVEELFTRHDDPQIRSAFGRVFGDIRALRDEARADGASLAVLVFPFRFQVMPDAPPPRAQEALAAFCRDEGIPFLDLLPAVQAIGASAYHDYDHFSAAGARAVAEAVAASGLIAGSALPAATATTADAHELLATLEHAATPQERTAAAWALGKRGTAAGLAVPALTRSLENQSAPLRAGAAWALGEIGPAAQPARSALIRRLSDPDESVRWRAADAASALGVDRSCCLAELVEVLKDSERPGRAEAARLVGRLGGEGREAVPFLVDALRDGKEEVRAQAAVALGAVGPAARSAVPALLTAFRDATIRWQIADALAAIGPDAPGVVAVLTSGLADPASSVRWRSASALEGVRDLPAPTTDALATSLADPSENVRLAALKVLAKTPAAEGLAPLFIRALGDSDTRVRLKAVDVVAKIGSPDSLTALEALSQDKDETVRDAASRAIKKLKRRAA